MSLSSDSASAFSDYGPKPVIDHYGLHPELNQAAILAVKFLYKCMYDTLPISLNRAERAQQAINLCIGKIGQRIEIFNLYSKFFFPKEYKENHDALVIALICDELTSTIHADVILKDGITKKYFDAIDGHLAKQAADIWKAAQYLCDHGMSEKDRNQISLESVLIAHVYGIEHYNDMKKSIDEYGTEFLKYIEQTEFQAAESLLFLDTMIGIDLKAMIDDLKEKIKSKTETAIDLAQITPTVRFMPYLAIDNTLPRHSL